MAGEELLLGRQMPHSLEAEQAVLGSMLIDADCVKDVMDKLQPGDFYLRQNREIFETIYTMFSYSKPVDGVTVAEEMQKNGTYDELTTRNYLVQLMEVTPTSAMRSFSSMAKLTSSTIALTFCILLRCSTLTNMISPAHLPQPFGVAVLDPIAIPFAEPERESLITQADESACRIRQRMTLQKLFALREVQLADMPQ